MMYGWVLCTRFFSSSILFLMPFMLILNKTMFCPLVDCCLWVGRWWFDGDGLLCWLCLALLLRVVWVCEWFISSRVYIVVVLSVCISDEPSVCCVWLHLIEVCCLFIVCDKGHKSIWLEWVFVCVCRRARIWFYVPRFCEEQSQPGGMERRPACPKTESGRGCVDVCSIPTSCRMCLFGTGNLFILIINTIPYYSDGIYVEYLIHMTYIRTIKMFILCRITTNEYVYWIPMKYCALFFYLYIIIISILFCIDMYGW